MPSDQDASIHQMLCSVPEASIVTKVFFNNSLKSVEAFKFV